jgi:hypothetical protein
MSTLTPALLLFVLLRMLANIFSFAVTIYVVNPAVIGFPLLERREEKNKSGRIRYVYVSIDTQKYTLC